MTEQQIYFSFSVYFSREFDTNNTKKTWTNYSIQPILGSTGTDKAHTSDADEALHDKEEKRRKGREACMCYYYKNKERISQQFKDKLKNDEDFKNKVKELNRINKAKLRNNEEFREKTKQSNRM